MARKKSKFTVADFNNYMRRESVEIEPPSIAETGGLSDFFALIKKQGEEIRSKRAEIPRNHVWADETPKKARKTPKKGGRA